MIWRFLYLAVCTAALAGIVHISVVLLVPEFGNRDAYAVISRKTDAFAFKPVDGKGEEALIADVDPFFSYGVCRFQLGETGVQLSGPKYESFWSAAVLDQNGGVIYSLNSRTAIDGRFDLIILDPLLTLKMREVKPQEAETSIIIEADVAAGFVVLRVLRPDSSWDQRTREFLNGVTCKPYVPQLEEEPAADG